MRANSPSLLGTTYLLLVLFIVCLVIEAHYYFFSDEVLNPKPEMSEDHFRMASRAMMSTNIQMRSSANHSVQMQNAVVRSSRPVFSAGGQSFFSAKSKQRTKQSKMVHTDYTRGSDSEDSE